MSTSGDEESNEKYQIQDVFEQLDELEEHVDSDEERHEVRRTRRMLERVPGRRKIAQYTGRDIAEGFVGGIIFALPLLVEDGVFVIAEWFASERIGPVPVFLLANICFLVGLTTGLLYYTDIREVRVHLIFGFIPRRLTAALLISLTVAAGSLFVWGRLAQGDPTNLEQFARITVVWTAAALGASLGDILPEDRTGDA